MKQYSLGVVPLTLLFVSPISNAEDKSVEILSTIKLSSGSVVAPYVGKSSSVATKFEIDPMKASQKVDVVSHKVLEDTNAQRVNDTLAIVSGVSALNPMGGLWDNYSVRGFNTDQTIGASSLRNGINSNLGMSAARDMVNVEQIEFLKGPAAAMYGAGDPGGTLNVITKKPKFEPQHSLQLRGGSYDQYRAAVDSTNALTDTVAYRFGLAYENNHSFRDYVKNNRLFFAPQLTWQPSDNTQVDYDSEYSFTRSMFDRGVLAQNKQLGVIPNSRFLGEKADGLMTMKDYLQQVRVKQVWNDQWTSQAAFNYKENDWSGFSSEAFQLLNSKGDLNRERRYRDYKTTSYLINHDLLGQFETWGIPNKLVIGTTASYLDIKNNLQRYRVRGANSVDIVNIYNPVYGSALPNVKPTFSPSEKQKNLGLSVTDMLDFTDQWSVTLGGRFDVYQQSYSESSQKISGSRDFNHFSPKFATNYLINDQFSVFAGAGQSFHLNSGLNIQNQPLDPEKAWTYEVGLKTKLFNDQLTSSMSVFHVKKENVARTDMNNSAYMTTTGAEKSRGLELDLTAQPTDALNVKLAYTYIDAAVTQGDASQGINKGARLLNTPKHTANLLAMYDVWQSGAQKVGIGGNIQYVSARSGNVADDGFELPAYTLVNVNSYYQVNEKLRFQMTLNNALNKTYYSSSLKDLWVTPGNPRELFLTMNYQF
ncbi:TonB-dependent siderophore receptor [Acinetobacter nectaris]|uniref:TonB-dependent siderophore receptor n=1 Tax=Acinetobacter nectaris TaxID=1219382 RepID=UPI001F256624|nr:TonB-dependent receptor [Acinetobacter nectaris]MCF8999855.1 TonB-dependent receptor [Acinetobacter nectaris]MCF9027338.1 TonB-dependent receptor [Acinetobacter nectaris]